MNVTRVRFEYGEDEPRGGFGNAILTRLPVAAIHQRQLTWPDTTYDRTERSEPRSLLLVTLEREDGGLVHVGSTHLPRGDDYARTRALSRLRDIVEVLPGSWVICGDFNTAPATWISSTDQVTAAPHGVPTYPTDSPTEAIDYAMAGSGISIEAEVLAMGGSDHLAISIELL